MYGVFKLPVFLALLTQSFMWWYCHHFVSFVVTVLKLLHFTVVAVVLELVREKNADQAKFCVLVKKICVKHLDKDVDK